MVFVIEIRVLLGQRIYSGDLKQTSVNAVCQV